MQVVRSTEPEDEPEPQVELTDEDRLALRTQLVEAHTQSQTSYDTSLRAFAAGGIAVTASIGAAVHTFGGLGTAAIAAFLASLMLMLLSHASATRDMRVRVVDLELRNDHKLTWNRWTTITTWLNAAAGIALLAGGVLLAVFVGVH
jgi:hypothetical protein